MTTPYDPRACGALCGICPMGPNGPYKAEGGPVRPFMPAGAQVVAVGQEAGHDEVLLDEPLVGPSGQEFDRGLEEIGWRREQIAKNNVLACQPPMQLKFLLGRLDLENRKHRKAGQPTIPTPMECCAPRLYTETRRFSYVIPLGATATALLVPSMRGSFDSQRGKMIELGLLPPGVEPPSRAYVPGRKLLPTNNPARILRERGLRKVFRNDLARAKRFFEGGLQWAEPWILAVPSVAQVQAFLDGPGFTWRGRRAFTFDTETSFDDGWMATMHCVQVGTTEGAIVIPLRSRHDKNRRFYSPADEAAIRAALTRWMHDDSILKIGHNILAFDRGVLEQDRNLGAWPAGSTKSKALLDTILVKRCAQPDTDHNLGYCGSYYTDVYDWKGSHAGTEAKSDEELWKYGGLDAVITARIVEPMFAEAAARDQIDILRVDHRVSDICYDMTRTGMLVDQAQRAAIEAEYTNEVRLWSYRARTVLEAAGIDPDKVRAKITKKKKQALIEEMGLARSEEKDDDWRMPGVEFLGEDFLLHNPASHQQLRAILFEEWALEPPSDLKPEELLTSSGEISTSDSVLRALLQRSHLTETQRKYIRAVRTLRKKLKILGTYLLPLRPGGDMLKADGRTHPRWLNFIPITGRVASRGPNAQNVPGWLRSMFVPAAGHVFVGADKDQLELRIAACLWGLQLYLDAFATIEDPHQVTMALVMGQGDIEKGKRAMMQLPGAPPEWGSKAFKKGLEFEKIRKLDKNVQFGGQYGAGDHVLHRLITSIEDKKGNFLFGHMRIEDAGVLRAAWLKGVPELQAGWQATKTEALRQGFLREPIGGRRRDFVDGGTNLSEVVNFKVQAAAAACVNLEMIDLSEAFPRDFGGPSTGIINQCHDQIVLEVPESRADEVRRTMDEIMGEHWFPGFALPMTAKAGIGRNWEEA